MSIRLLSLGITLTLFAAVASAQSADDLPIERIVLFSSGVGYIQHAGSVEGEGTATLHFTQAQLDDVLKSLVVEDRGGGMVEVVTFPSRAASGSSPRFRFDGGGSGVSALLAQLTGAEIEVERPSGIYRGRLIGTDRVTTGDADRVYISVLTPRGIEPVPFDGLTAIRATDPELQAEIARALAEVSEAHAAPGGDPLQVSFRGSGTRQVTLGYVVQQPLWKTSYRLVLPSGDGRGHLQGWAIIENHTDRNWNGVSLSLISGRPISFVTQLSRPIFVNRPHLDVRTESPSRTPVRYGAGVPAGTIRGRVTDETGSPVPGAHVTLQGTNRGTVTNLDGHFELQNLATGAHTVQVSIVGYERERRDVDLRRGGATVDFVLTPGVGLNEVVVSGAMTEMHLDMDLDLARGRAETRSVDVTRSVEAIAQVGEVGEVFEYSIGNVRLPRGEAAMLPIVTGRVDIERVSLYQAEKGDRHPLRGFRMRNATGQNLQGGPTSVFDDGNYAGDIYLPDLVAGSRQFLSYAADLDLVVTEDLAGERQRRLTTARIENGVLVMTTREITTSTYTVENRGDRRRQLLIEHPRKAANLVAPQSDELIDGGYRLRMDLRPNRTETLLVREEETTDSRTAIIDSRRDQLLVLAQGTDLPANVRQSLQRAAELQREHADAQRSRAQSERRVEDLRAEEARARENIQALPADAPFVAELIGRVQRLDAQISTVLQEIEEQRREETRRRAALEAYVRNLNVGG